MTGRDGGQVLDRAGNLWERDALLAPLRARLDFLLRSIADLEAEHANGELPLERYVVLHDDYTVQAATVLRAISRLEVGGAADDPTATPGQRRWRRPFAFWGLIIVALFSAGAFVLSRAVDDRSPGQTITGNAQSEAEALASGDLEALASAARMRPDDATAQMSYGQGLLEARRPADALKAFDDAARLDPSDPAAKAYGGMVVYLAGLVDESIRRLDVAVAGDPSYPDARFFRGLVYLRGRNDPAAALSDLREFLRLVPPGPDRARVQTLVAEIEASGDGTAPPTPVTPSEP